MLQSGAEEGMLQSGAEEGMLQSGTEEGMLQSGTEEGTDIRLPLSLYQHMLPSLRLGWKHP